MSASGDRRVSRWPSWAVLFGPYLVLVLCHLLLGSGMEQPLILADEAGYLGNARYLSGTGHLPDLRSTQFYHFGYSLFLLPAFWLFSEPHAIYRAAVFINALLASALYFPLRFVLVSFAGVDENLGRWIAFACCLYPPLLLHANFAWSEAVYVPLYALTVALFGRLLASRSIRDVVAFGLVAAFLYTVHPRATPVVVVVLLYLVVLALLRAVPARRILTGAALMGAVLLITRLVNEHLQAEGWSGGGDALVSKLPGRLAPGASDLVSLLERASGQLLYLSQASHGMFLLGLVAMIALILAAVRSKSLGRALSTPETGVPIFVLATGFGVLVGSSLSKLYSLHGTEGLRGANFIHGRYNEAFAVLCIAFGLAACCRGGLETRRLVRGAIVSAAVLGILTVVVVLEIQHALVRQAATIPGTRPAEAILPSRVDAIAVPGIYPLVEVLGSLDLQAISLFALVSFVAITVATRFSGRAGMALLMVIFAAFTYYNHREYLQPLQERSRPRLEFASAIRDLGPIPAISYDRAYRRGGLRTGLQFLLPDTVFDRFDSSLGETPESAVVISGANWPQAAPLGARFVTSLSGRSVSLWALPGSPPYRLARGSFEGLDLGSEPVEGVRESGFHRPETFGVVRGRWTKARATLGVPLGSEAPPRSLRIDAMAPGRDGAPLRVLANGVELWNGRIPSHAWSQTFDLERVQIVGELLIELETEAFSPAETIPGSTDKRRLGIVLTGVRLTGSRERND